MRSAPTASCAKVQGRVLLRGGGEVRSYGRIQEGGRTSRFRRTPLAPVLPNVKSIRPNTADAHSTARPRVPPSGPRLSRKKGDEQKKKIDKEGRLFFFFFREIPLDGRTQWRRRQTLKSGKTNHMKMKKERKEERRKKKGSNGRGRPKEKKRGRREATRGASPVNEAPPNETSPVYSPCPRYGGRC